MTRGTVHLQLSDSPLIRLNGPADSQVYLDIIDGAYSAYRCGMQEITIDFEHCPHIDTAGLFALHTIHMLFRGETPAAPEDGWTGLKSMAERNREVGLAPNVYYQNAPPAIRALLSEHSLM